MKISKFKLESFLKKQSSDYEVQFYKKDGTNRKMICSNDLPKPKGIGKPIVNFINKTAKSNNPYMLVKDKEKNDYRVINISTTYKVIAEGTEYEVN